MSADLNENACSMPFLRSSGILRGIILMKRNLAMFASLVVAGSLDMASFDEKSVLLEFHRAANGRSWKHEGWDKSVSISAWYGVTVGEDGSVVKLVLVWARLTGETSESFAKCQAEAADYYAAFIMAIKSGTRP